MWDPVAQRGVLSDFDSVDSLGHTVHDFVGKSDSTIAELLDCKKMCDNRSSRLSHDLVEPIIWLLVAAYLGSEILFNDTSGM